MPDPTLNFTNPATGNIEPLQNQQPDLNAPAPTDTSNAVAPVTANAPPPAPPPTPVFTPLEATNPDDQSSSQLIKNYNDFRARGGLDSELSYDDLYNVRSVAKGLTNNVDPQEVLNNPDLYFHQVYQAGKAPVMIDDVINQSIQHPETIPNTILSGVDWVANQARTLADAAVHGVADIGQDFFTGMNPWANPQDRDMANARLANGILRGFKGGISMVPQLVQGVKETIQYDDLQNRLSQVTDPAQRDQIEHQISEVLRQGQLREQQNTESVNNAYKDLQGIFNATGISAAMKGLGLPDRLQLLGQPEAQPSQGEAMLLQAISDPTNLVTGGLGELAGTVKSAVRMGDFESAVDTLNTMNRTATSLAAERTATNAALAAATDDATKASLRESLARTAASEKQNAADLATQNAVVSGLGTAVNKQITDIAPTLMQKVGGGVVGGFGQAMDGLANVVDNVTKVPGYLAERLVGSNAPEETKAAVTDVLSDMAKDGLGYIGLAHAGPAGYMLGKIATPIIRMLGNPDGMRAIARDANVVGDQLSLGTQTLPALQEIASKTSGLNSAIASLMDNPLVRSLPAAVAGGAQGAATGALLGGIQSGGTVAGAGQGALQGGVFGAAGAGHGQIKSYNSPAELRNAAIGDRARFVATMNPDHKPLFNQLRPDTQLAIGVFAHAHPDMKVGFVNDPKGPNGAHYITDDGAHVILNVAADNPLDAVLTHEIAHHIVAHGLQDAVTDNILGNPATGHVGLFTHLDENGKPVVMSTEDPVTGTMRQSYMPDQRLLKYQSEYNARKLRDLPDSTPEDLYGISQEIFAELSSHMFTNREQMQKLIRGVVPSDLVNTSAISNFFSKLGLPFDAGTGGLAAHPDQIKNIQGLNDIVTNYVKGKEFKNHPLEHEDGYSRVTPDAWRTNPDVLYRNLDGAGILSRDPKTGEVIKGADGLPILKGAKETDKEHAQFTKSVLDLIRANPSSQSGDVKAGWVLMKDRNGREVYRTQNVPDHIFSQLAETNQYNPFQLANWQKVNELTRRDDGSVMQANYNTAKGRGGKYTTVEMKERSLVPLYTEVSPKTAQTNIQAYDPGQMMLNITRMLKRKAAQGLWGSAGDALADVHTYMENLASGKPGETTIGLQKKQAINAMFGINTQGNPMVEQLTGKIPSVFKTFRIDRTNKAREVVGVTRPVYSGTYEQVRAFMQPRVEPAAPAAAEPATPAAAPTTHTLEEVVPDSPVYKEHPWLRNVPIDRAVKRYLSEVDKTV